MSGIEPNTKERAERIGLEEDLSVDDVALLSLSQEPNERPLKVTVGGELSANPIDQIPTPGPILLLNPVSGRYKSQGAGYQLELRVDVDGKRPMSSVSGDSFEAIEHQFLKVCDLFAFGEKPDRQQSLLTLRE